MPALNDHIAWQLRVERLLWVVGDTKAAVAGWEKVNLIETMPAQDLVADLRYRGDPVKAKLRWTVARVGDTIVDFVEPREGNNAFSAFHKSHKDGVMALVHRVDDMAALEREIERHQGPWRARASGLPHTRGGRRIALRAV
ncbi:MAG: hypothetical protein U5J83_06305, partial [Bryobacterales bacterium]|nr:hypothetical protein [Bryobacterales bacterium]